MSLKLKTIVGDGIGTEAKMIVADSAASFDLLRRLILNGLQHEDFSFLPPDTQELSRQLANSATRDEFVVAKKPVVWPLSTYQCPSCRRLDALGKRLDSATNSLVTKCRYCDFSESVSKT